MKIAVGTTSEQKLGYLREILEEFHIDADIIPVEVVSGVSDQPTTDIETKTGSINRAKAAMTMSGDSDVALGIEVGYHLNKNEDYRIFCWASLMDRTGKVFSAKSHSFVLPHFHQKILKNGGYLGDYVRQFIDENDDETSKIIGELIKNRKPFIVEAIKNLIMEWWFAYKNN